jgi:CDP-4-dehydro-6-deoxyglucose reductase
MTAQAVRPSRTVRLPVKIVERRQASERTMILRLALPEGAVFEYRPGQYVGLEASDGRQRFFSLACAEAVNNELELHVNRVPGGAFTTALFETARLGDQYWMEGPFGAFSIPDAQGPKTLLVAGGTGLAPIRACLERMVADGTGKDRELYFYWGVRSRDDLYDLPAIGKLCDQLPGLRFTAVVGQNGADRKFRTGLVHRAVIEDFADLSEFDICACGVPAMIDSLSRDCAAERGFDPGRLIADSFAAGPGACADAAIADGPASLTLMLCGADGPQTLVAYAGESLLAPLKRAGLALAAICGGNGACGTCRIHVPAGYRSRLPDASRHEIRLLKHVGAQDGDRLSCRIPLTAELNGLEIHACARQGDS